MDYQTWFQSIPLAAPAAGAALLRRIPGEVFEVPQSIRFTFTASAAVANRFPSVDFLDGDSSIVARVQSTVAVVASTAAVYNFFVRAGSNTFAATGEQHGPLPELLLPAGFFVRVTASGLQAADQISAAQYFVRRCPTSDWSPSDGATPYSPELAVLIP